MASITLRSVKGSPLTNNEIDSNFSNLNDDKIEDGDSLDALSIANATITGGSITNITDLAIADGGTGASTVEGVRTNLGLVIGTHVQGWDADLDNLAALAKTVGNFIVGNGTAWEVQSGATVRTSLGLGSMALQASNSVTITGGSIAGITDLAVADGGTGSSTASGARTNLGLGSLAVLSSINNTVWDGEDLSLENGGTGASSAAGARTNLGLGTVATENTVPVSKGGTGRTSLTANNVVLGNGSDAVNFVAPGTSGNILTSNGTTWQSAARPQGIGEGQTWQNVKSSRSSGTTYTNSTGKPIMVATSSTNVNGFSYMASYCDGILLSEARGATPTSTPSSTGFSFIVPNGSTYMVVFSGTGINTWVELR